MRRLGTIYEQTRGTIVKLTAGLGAEAASLAIPACPEWSVRDVIAHTAGVCSDILAGNLAGTATNAWTAAQVESRRNASIPEILAEWDEVGPKVAAMIDDFPGRYGHQLVSDVTTHEHDIRGALDRAGARDSDGVAISADFLVTVMLRSAITSFGLEPFEIRSGDQVWVVGTGDAPTDNPEEWREALLSDTPDEVPATPPRATLTVEPFELCRAGSGRRSTAEIRRLDWAGDSEPYLSIFGFGPFSIRATELNE